MCPLCTGVFARVERQYILPALLELMLPETDARKGELITKAKPPCSADFSASAVPRHQAPTALSQAQAESKHRDEPDRDW